MAYIDVDKFAEKICNFQAIDEDCANKMIWLLRTFPTANVVEVVRCKECKHKVDYCGRLMCGRNKYEFAEGVGGLVATLPEHFCSYGTPKERGDNNG